MEVKASWKRLGILMIKSFFLIVLYLDGEDVTTIVSIVNDIVNDSIYTLGTLKVHHAR